MGRLLLLERIPPEFQPEPGDQIFPLNAEASYGLHSRQIPHAIPSDLGVEQQLKEREQDFWRQQLDFFRQVDSLLWSRFPELESRQIRPTFFYGYFLKRMLDDLCIRGLEGKVLLNRLPREVLLWTEQREAPKNQDLFSSGTRYRTVYPRLFSALCAQRGISYRQFPAANRMTPPTFTFLRTGARRLRNLGRQTRWIFSPIRPREPCLEPRGRCTFLFLESSYDFQGLIPAALQKGHRCLLRYDQQWVDLQTGKSPRAALKPPPPSFRDSDRWEDAAEEFFCSSSPLWRWLNEWLGLPAAPLLQQEFKDWIRRILPEMLSWSDTLAQMYSREQVDFVLTPALTSNLHVAAIGACQRPGRTRSVLIAHGDGGDVEPAWDLFDLFPYHHYFVPDAERAGYFQQRKALYSFPTAQLHVGSYRWKEYTRLAARKSKQPSKKEVVVYVCGQPERDLRYLNTIDYSETDYFKLQEALIRTFADMPQYEFIVKLFPGPRGVETALGRWVRDLRAPHLHLSTEPFKLWLPRADRVILDTLSTPLYECALAGVPLHLLLHRSVLLRPIVSERLASCVTPFQEPSEAAEGVRRYLQSAPPPAPSFHSKGQEILQTLETLAGPVPEDHGLRPLAMEISASR